VTVRLAPSILSCDFARLGEQIGEADRAGADVIHVDVMDGQFVPNITIGPLVVAASRRATELPLDVHLMIEKPERFVAEFVEAGADWLTIHAEATPHVHRALQMIREAGARPGLAVNPLTPLAVLRESLPDLGLALVMSVNPGFGGQRFIPASLARLRALRAWRDELNPDCLIEVDGGVGVHNAAEVARAGADVLVAGSAVFNDQGSVAANVAALRRAAG
jgi:ribulose-phosphate 3-epimerase